MAGGRQRLGSARALGIYVHIPFCKSKCIYCDFYSLPQGKNTEKQMDRYTDALLTHIRECGARAEGYQVDTIYFGGGTPSWFGAARLRRIYKALTKAFDVSRTAEVTLEANPDSVSARELAVLRRTGFNRISLGVQTNDDRVLRALGRPHNFAQSVKALQAARSAGFENVSLDLMYGLPAQTPQQWADALGTIIDLGPEHISCYGLTVDEGTPLWQMRDQAMLPDDDAQAAMYLYAVSTLEAYGYHQYEISNFAKEGYQCIHNLKYWMGGEYLSFGPSAASDFAGTRYTFVSDLGQYDKGIRDGGSITTENEYLPVSQRAGEYIMLRMRTIYGIERKEYEETFLMPFDPLEALLKSYVPKGLTQRESGRWHFTPRGFLVSNQLIGQLIDAQLSGGRLTPYSYGKGT